MVELFVARCERCVQARAETLQHLTGFSGLVSESFQGSTVCFNTPLAFEPQEDDAKANDDDGATRVETKVPLPISLGGTEPGPIQRRRAVVIVLFIEVP